MLEAGRRFNNLGVIGYFNDIHLIRHILSEPSEGEVIGSTPIGAPVFQ